MAQLEHPGVTNDPLTPVVFLERTVRVFPRRTAVVHGDRRWDWQEFAEEVGRMAGALRRAGVNAGDRVAILSPNTPWHLAAHFAAPLLAAPLVSINTRLAPAEICVQLQMIVFPEPGKYEIQLTANGEPVGGRDFTVTQAQMPPGANPPTGTGEPEFPDRWTPPS